MLSKDECIKKINLLLSSQSGRLGKYYRNYRLYTGNPSADLESIVPSVVGYQPENYSVTLEDDTPKFNVIKSAIDSVVSKLAQARCRPFVNCNMGRHKSFMIARNLQSFLDSYCDRQQMNKKVAAILRDSMIFDSGYLYFDAENVEWIRVLPWNVYLLPQEVTGNGSKLQNAYIEFPHYPVDQLSDDLYGLIDESNKNSGFVQYGVYYNAKTKTKATLMNRRVKKIEEGYDEIPIIRFNYCEPLVGNSALSVADMLCGIQQQIDILMKKICEASRLSIAANYFVPQSLGVSASLLNNRIGNIIPINSVGDDIQVFNPEFINPQYQELLNDLIERAYNLVGVSQLSSQGKKETGITSGVALSTMESLENDRFELELHQYIDCFTNMTKTMINVMGSGKFKNDSLLDDNRYTYKCSWKDIKEEESKLRLMFSSADLLSKDPSEKLKQLQALAQAGLLPIAKIGQLMEIPDIQSGFSFISNAENACQTVINKALYEGDYDIPSYIPISLLKEDIQNTQMLLRSAEGEGDTNEKDIRKLQALWEKADAIEEEMNASAPQEEVGQEQAEAPNLDNGGQPSEASEEGRASPYANLDFSGSSSGGTQ